MNPNSSIENLKQTPRYEKPPMVLTEKGLESMLQVPFENLCEVIEMGDAKNPEINKLNQEATDLWEKVCAEIKAEVSEADRLGALQAAVEKMKRKVEERKQAAERQAATREAEARRLTRESPEYATARFLEMQRKREPKPETPAQKKAARDARLARIRKKYQSNP